MTDILHPLQVIPLGVGNSFSQRNYPTAFLVLGGRTRLLIDCPDPLRKILFEATSEREYPTDAHQLHGVLLTHLHGDHANGLESLGYWRKYCPTSPGRPFLYSIDAVLNALWDERLRGPMGRALMPTRGIDARFALDDFFEPSSISPGEIARTGDLNVRIRLTNHTIPCFGCRIEYGGRSVGYSGDTDFDPEQIEFLADCDLIFHETGSYIHTPYEKLALLSSELRRKMLLVHLDDNFDRAASIIPCAMPGHCYIV